MADMAVDMFERIAMERQKTVNAILQLLNQMIQESNAAFKDKEITDSLEELTKHVKKGGEIKTDMVDTADAAMFESLLKKYRVSYSAVKGFDPQDGRERVVFLTKDTDQTLMDLVRKQYFYELGVGLNEISLVEMAKMAEGEVLGVTKGLTPEEMELFRYYASDYSLNFAVSRNDFGYDVYFPQDSLKEIKVILRKAVYDLSIPEYRDRVEQRIQGREAFDKRVAPKKKETYVIADAANPNNFVTVGAEGFALHHIEARTEKGQGEEIRVQYSIKDQEYSSFERERLMSFVSQFKTPVVLTDPGEFPLISGFEKDGSIRLPAAEKISGIYEELKERLSERAEQEEAYSFTKSFGEMLSADSSDPEREEREATERWALSSEEFYPDELGERLQRIIEAVEERTYDQVTVDRSFLEAMLHKTMEQKQRQEKGPECAAVDMDTELGW